MGTDGEAGFAAADFDDGAGRFMPEDARRSNEAVVNFFDVGRANAADGDFDEEFVWADGWNRDGFKAQVIGTAIDDGAHGLRNVEHRKGLIRIGSKGTKNW